MMQNSELCCSDYMTEEEHERLENARKELEKVLLELERKPTMLWRLFRETALLDGGECRDIVEKHILPRLNRTDVKFLYEVNTETRKLIKRSSREGELKKGFIVREMSSISTLEVAWENNRCGRVLVNETYFCWQVALTNKLELLKWAREEKKCEWNVGTINMAADQGNLEMVKYCVANECPVNEFACAYAAKNGHLECLKYLREEVKAPWDSILPLGRLQMVISTYSNILLSVSMINIDELRVVCGPERPLGLFEVLTRNRQMALGLSGRSRSAREQPHRLCTIPPRQRLSITIWLAIRRWRVTHRDRIRIRIKLNVITRPAHTYAHQKITSEEKHKHTKPQKNHHTNSRMGNSNNKMTRSCVPSSTGSDKNNVKTMDERIDALVLRLHEVFLRSRSSRPSHAFCVRIFKHFERFFPG